MVHTETVEKTTIEEEKGLITIEKKEEIKEVIRGKTSETKFVQEADEIMNSNTDLPDKEKVEMDEFFSDTEQVQVTVEESTSHEAKLEESESERKVIQYSEFKESLVAVNTEVAEERVEDIQEQSVEDKGFITMEKKQEDIKEVKETLSLEKEEAVEQKTSEVVVEEVTIETDEIIEEDKTTYKAESLKVSNKDDVMKALKKKTSDEAFKPQRLVKNRIDKKRRTS